MRAAESMTARIHRHLSATGLTISQFAVLEALYQLGPLSQREIGKKILRSSGNITMVIDNLEKNGLVRRERHEADRRFFIVHLTDKGYHLINKIFPPHAAVIAKDLGVLTAAEQDALARLCKKLGLSEES
jgi:MarR family 2-MHQ and catechol resistance regulon transcriptional repressor